MAPSVWIAVRARLHWALAATPMVLWCLSCFTNLLSNLGSARAKLANCTPPDDQHARVHLDQLAGWVPALPDDALLFDTSLALFAMALAGFFTITMTILRTRDP